jgi:hypothetical protein
MSRRSFGCTRSNILAGYWEYLKIHQKYFKPSKRCFGDPISSYGFNNPIAENTYNFPEISRALIGSRENY